MPILAIELLVVIAEGLAPALGLLWSETRWGSDVVCWLFDSTLEKEMVEVNPESALEPEGLLSFPLRQNRAREQKERCERDVTGPHKTIVSAGIGLGECSPPRRP